MCIAGMTTVDGLKFMNARKSRKRGLVYKWHARFSNGRENITDDDGDGRPKTTERVRSGINEELNEDRRKTSYRASLRVMNHGSISMTQRQKQSQWCGIIHHHLHQRRLRLSSLLKK